MWPFRLIVKVPDDSAYYTYQPKSDLLVLKSLLPRLLVEAHSTTSDHTPQDRYRMLLQGASIVRLANKVLRAFSQNKDFVLVAIYVGDDAKADRHVLFQEPQSNQVCRRTRVFNQ
jgi:hypothetical protein